MFRYPPALGALCTALCLLVAATPARADDARSPTCRRILAEAGSQADLLFAPRLSVQGLRVPTEGDIDGGNTLAGDGYQARASLALSPLDMYKGALVMRGARAECRVCAHARRSRARKRSHSARAPRMTSAPLYMSSGDSASEARAW